MKKIDCQSDALQAIARDIEIVREKLQKAAMRKKYKFLDAEVIALSQKLDGLIVKYQKATRWRGSLK